MILCYIYFEFMLRNIINLFFLGTLIIIGWGTDEKGIITILGHRNAGQRKEIRVVYEQLYQEDLLKRLESELSGNFEVLL